MNQNRDVQQAKPATLRLRIDAIRGAMASQGITSVDRLAITIGISRATAFRIMGGSQEPSAAFIAGLRLRLGLPFDLAVEAVETGSTARSA